MRERFTRSDWRRLGGFAAVVVGLHLAGLGLILLYAPSHPVFVGLATLAYGFGLRHAFDADHIAAIDNTTRKLRADGERPLGVGFFFSLGHSTVVLGLAVALALAARAVGADMPALQRTGSVVGLSISGVFLWAIAILNLVVLLDIVAISRRLHRGELDEAALEQRLLDRGLMNRMFIGRLARRISRSWHAYPIGLLFGLGFDTASEVGLLALTAGAATGHAPFGAIIALPLLFAAGMSLMDTIDGVFMSRAYGWAFASPVRKIYYNITVTGLSVLVAMLVGTIELLQVLGDRLRLSGGFWSWLGGLSFETLGYAIVALFALTWGLALLVWRMRRIEERWGARLAAEAVAGGDGDRLRST